MSWLPALWAFVKQIDPSWLLIATFGLMCWWCGGFVGCEFERHRPHWIVKEPPPQEARDELERQVRAVVEGRTPARSASWGTLGGAGAEEKRVTLRARARPNYGDVTVTVERFLNGQEAGSFAQAFNADDRDGTGLALAVDAFVGASAPAVSHTMTIDGKDVVYDRQPDGGWLARKP